MNGRNFVLAGILLATSLIPMTVSAHEEQDQQIVKRATYHAGWIAEHNYQHRLRLGRLNPSTKVETPPGAIEAWRSTPLYRE